MKLDPAQVDFSISSQETRIDKMQSSRDMCQTMTYVPRNVVKKRCGDFVAVRVREDVPDARLEWGLVYLPSFLLTCHTECARYCTA